MIWIQTLMEWLMQHYLHILLLGGLAFAWYEHKRFCAEHRDGKWWF